MKNDDFFTRGERLKEERKRLGVNTQDDLAELLGLKKNSIVRFEKHNDPMTTEMLDKLEDHGFDIGYLLWGKRFLKPEADIISELSTDERAILSMFRELDEHAQKGLLAITKTYTEQFSRNV